MKNPKELKTLRTICIGCGGEVLYTSRIPEPWNCGACGRKAEIESTDPAYAATLKHLNICRVCGEDNWEDVELCPSCELELRGELRGGW
jgi:hypothetical protein